MKVGGRSVGVGAVKEVGEGVGESRKGGGGEGGGKEEEEEKKL
jgi:hypothetical protein